MLCLKDGVVVPDELGDRVAAQKALGCSIIVEEALHYIEFAMFSTIP